jgi:hypothetical protein
MNFRGRKLVAVCFSTLFEHRLSVISALVLSLACATPAKGQSYEVEGVTTFRYTGPTGATNFEDQRSFVVQVRDCQWLITTKPILPGDSNVMAFWEVGSDGTNVYHYAQFSKYGLKPNSANKADGMVEVGSVPKDMMGNEISMVWVPFASACYFPTATNMVVPPYSSILPTNEYIRMEVRLLGPGGLPQSIQYFNPGYFFGYVEGKMNKLPAPSPFDKGFVEATYSATQTTNIGSLVIPTRCTFSNFFLKSNSGNKVELYACRTVETVVSSVKDGCSLTNFLPTVSEATWVGDRRFSTSEKPINEIGYMITNYEWPSTNAPWVVAAYTHEVVTRPKVLPDDKASLAPPSTSNPLARRIVVGLLILSSLCFILLLLRNLSRSKGNHLGTV